AGKPHRVELIPDRKVLLANGKDLSYITVRVVDKDGNFCPQENRLMKFSVTGSGTFRSAANGDPTSLELFHLPQMHTFNGQLTAIVQSGTSAGEIDVEFSSEGLQSGKASMVSIEYKK
ncbi:MAG: hypothetical protein LBT89_07750, partial [Planctomycetaceae bacterium]|nr:hypothetical protein [Planctomycetaceae bacterium]